jgi:hypothetical protein
VLLVKVGQSSAIIITSAGEFGAIARQREYKGQHAGNPNYPRFPCPRLACLCPFAGADFAKVCVPSTLRQGFPASLQSAVCYPAKCMQFLYCEHPARARDSTTPGSPRSRVFTRSRPTSRPPSYSQAIASKYAECHTYPHCPPARPGYFLPPRCRFGEDDVLACAWAGDSLQEFRWICEVVSQAQY